MRKIEEQARASQIRNILPTYPMNDEFRSASNGPSESGKLGKRKWSSVEWGKQTSRVIPVGRYCSTQHGGMYLRVGAPAIVHQVTIQPVGV